ncbi:MAG: adenylosuccinate lyase [Bacteriovoracaceae bacterium]|nr:adenylosuccinate lyase [Bacteriovoracaceae bacterium]
MIPRYDEKEISSIWSEEHKFRTYIEVELALLNALEKNGQIPKGTSQKISRKGRIDVKRIDEIEKITKHDIIAFCTSITENVPPETGKYFHFGVTSSDIIDTTMMLQIKQSLKVILPRYRILLHTMMDLCNKTRDIISMGRSHGMFAEPVSFAQRWLGHYGEFKRRYDELESFYKNDITGQLSGAVGNYTILTPEIEKDALTELGLSTEPLSTQIIPRDRIAKLVTIGGLIGSSLERICVELRHLHRSDVNEISEGFSKGQKGSSTMPHKKNPISSENLSGMARILRSHMILAAENIVLWHERDISHSCAERMYLPDHLGILHYSLGRLESTLKNLVIHRENIENKVTNNFTYLSSYYLHHLIKSSDFTREKLYEVVQKAAFEGHNGNSAEIFHNTVISEMNTMGISIDLPKPDSDQIKNIYMKHLGTVFERVTKTYPLPE